MTISLDKEKYTIKLSRIDITKEEVDEFIKNTTQCRILIFKDGYSDLSFDPSIKTVPDMKMHYRGQTYIRIPISIAMDKNTKTPVFTVVEDDKTSVDGYAVISKRDIRDYSTRMKRADVSEVNKMARETVDQMLSCYGALLRSDVYDVVIRYGDTIINKRVIAPTLKELQMNILMELPFVDDQFDNDLIELIDNAEEMGVFKLDAKYKNKGIKVSLNDVKHVTA